MRQSEVHDYQIPVLNNLGYRIDSNLPLLFQYSSDAYRRDNIIRTTRRICTVTRELRWTRSEH